MAGKLFQEYAVDSWATTEQSRLNWVKLNQSKIRAETYQGLTDAVTADPTTHGHDLGQRLIPTCLVNIFLRTRGYQKILVLRTRT